MEEIDLKDEVKEIDIPFDWLQKEAEDYLLLKRNTNTSQQMIYNRYFYILGIIDTLRFTKHLSQHMYTVFYKMIDSL